MKRVLVLGGFCLVLAWPGWAQAPGQEELNELRATVREQAIVIEALRERLDAIEAKAEETQEQVTLAKEQIEEVKERKPESKPEDFRVYWKDGLKFETQDKRFKMQVGGRIQADWAWFDHGDEGRLRGWRSIHLTDHGGGHPYMDHWWVPGLQIGYEHTFIHQIADFLTGLGAGQAAQPDFRAALKTQRVCDAVLASASTGQWVDVVRD